jgi:undecaprenyl-diphosphatase
MNNWNLILFQKINNFAGQNIWLDRIGLFFSDYLAYVICAILLLAFIFNRGKLSRFMVLVAVLSLAVSRGVVTELIRHFYHHPRPFVAMPVHKLLGESGYSFPSGHAAFFFAIAMAVYFYNKKLGILFFIGSAIMGLARIFVGVHWPADILGGAVVGIFTALFVNWVLKKIVFRPAV